jgi:hypothetical protein
MKEYLDREGKKLEKGFYTFTQTGRLEYFTGNYNQDGLPLFDDIENINKPKAFFCHNVMRLIGVSKDEIKKKINDLEKEKSWMEQKLKEEEIIKIVTDSKNILSL